MLIKPPALHEDVLSNRSNSHSPAVKPRNQKKQSTIKLTGQPLQSNDMDNQSIHSNGSRASKTKRAKEGSLGGKIAIQNRDQDDDRQSVHSGASKKSHKVVKKQNSLGKAKTATFKDAIGQPEEEMITKKRQESPSVVEYTQKVQIIKPKPVVNRNPRFSPFQQIQQHADDGPIFRIQEPSAQKKKQVVIGSSFANKLSSKMNDSPINAFDGTIISQESRLVQTRNQRRRKEIFGPKQLQNVSKVDSIGQSSAFQDSRRKSKSKLGQLIRQSREKQKFAEQSKQSALNYQGQQSTLPQKSRMLDSSSKPAVAASRMVQVQRKILSEQNDNFAQEDSKSDLNLSVSRNNGQAAQNANQKDSLIFNFQPQKKKGKGLSVTSKEAKKEMHQLPANLVSKDLADNSSQLLQIQSNLISRQIPLPKKMKIEEKSEDEKKILQKLKENDDYISNSGILNLSEEPAGAFGMNHMLKQAYHKQIGNDFTKKQKVQVVDDEPWHKIVSEKEVLKKVDRKEVVPGKERLKIEDQKREYQKMLKIENQKRQIEKRQYQQKIRRKEADERQEKIKMERIKRIQQMKKMQEIKKKEQQNAKIKRMEQQRQLQKIKAAQQRQEPQQFQALPTTITAPLSQHSSDGSHGSARKKSKSKKQTTIKMNKPHKVQIRAQSPRQQDSFYEESQAQVKQKQPIKSIKQPNILSFDDQEIEQNKPKSKTDINFYPGNSQLSLKNPSSKPPLSRKSNASSSKSSKSKPKQSTLPIMVKNQKPTQAPMKKLTILERAMMARQQDSGSEVSSGSRDCSQNSRESRGSNGSSSRKSAKKESTLNIQLKTHTSKPPIPQKKQSQQSSDSEPPFSAHRTHPHHNSYQVQHKMQPPRTIISKDTYFIDANGRLVKQDLVIKGNEVYGRKGQQDIDREVYNRMRRSRERQRSRSKERSRSRQGSQNGSRIDNLSKYNGSKYNTSQNFHRGGYETSENQSAEQTYSQYTSSTYYAPAPAQNSSRPTQSPILRQFLKPFEHVPIHEPPKRLNQMFGESGVRRVMGRTQGSRKKYDY